MIEAPACLNKAEEKDLLESNTLNVTVNLQKYQEETRAWRDPKAKLQEFNVGNLYSYKAVPSCTTLHVV
jgi:hypothetical protein